jgi:hypothetical protein
MFTKIKIAIVFCSSLVTFSNLSQIHINREWEIKNGNPISTDWTSSITNSNNEIILVGNTNIEGQGANILTMKYDSEGVLIWERNFNTASLNNDYGSAVSEDVFGNIYVLGTTDNNSVSNYDIVVLKYSPTGLLLWSKIYDSPFNKNDIGVDLKISTNGNVYIVASSEGLNSNYDFLVLKYNRFGTFFWDNRYDYNSLIEVPISIELDMAGNAFVIGASASSLANWDYTIAKFGVNGNFMGATRNPLPGLGFDQPHSYKKDSEGNIYITGKSSIDGVNYDINTIKINPTQNIVWTKTLDFAGLEDAGNSIDVDSLGFVYVGGFVSKTNNVKEMFIVKYDPFGNEVWRHQQAGRKASEDAKILRLKVTSSGNVYFTGEETGQSNSTDVVVSKLSKNGNMAWQKRISEPVKEKPTYLDILSDGEIYVAYVTEEDESKYGLVKYSEFEQDNKVVNSEDGAPIYKAHELIVRFEPTALKKNAIDNTITTRQVEYAKLNYFLNQNAMNRFNNALKDLCGTTVTIINPNNPNKKERKHQDPIGNNCDIKAVKVFKQLKTTHTTTKSRLGETIKIPDFWTTLLLVFPEELDLKQIQDALETIPDVVVYSEPNFMVKQLGEYSNDTHYNEQHNLYSEAYPRAHINVQKAWDIIPSGGSPHIRCGVFDSRADYRHEDFGYDGVNPESSKIDGWSFTQNAPLRTLGFPSDLNNHGTACAGIIGAIRNNEIGIAGIAGGDDQGASDFSDKGISLYSLAIMNDGGEIISNPINYIYDALVTTCINSDSLDNTYGLHISSHSWAIYPFPGTTLFLDTNLTLLKEAVHFGSRLKTTFVAGRGNHNENNTVYPANADDDWVLSVGGTGLTGEYKDFNVVENAPSFGHNLDIAAPYSPTLTLTTTYTHNYEGFGGTSAAAPHVSGVAGLMMSYINDTIDAYNNLSPEDCERIIELSAVNYQTPGGYNDSVGWGKLDAGRAMSFIEKPWSKVNHFGTNELSNYTKSYTLEHSNLVISLRERYRNEEGTWFNKGSHRVRAYRVEATIEHELPENHRVWEYWPRPSSSTVLEKINYENSTLLPRERIKIENLTDSSCVVSGYVYEVIDFWGNSLGWWPFDTTLTNAHFEYTILSRDSLAPEIEPIDYTAHTEQSAIDRTEIFFLYPNPAKDIQTLELKFTEPRKIKVSLCDVYGRHLETVYENKSLHSDTLRIENNIAKLPSAVYFYKIETDVSDYFVRFIKY